MAHRASHSQDARKQTRLVPEEDPEFQIAPMIDILLVLLIFFMTISSQEVLQVTQEVQLPVAKDAGKKTPETGSGQAVVNILWSVIGNSGSIELDELKFADPNALTPILAERVKVTPKMRVLIRADRNVRYEFLRSVMVAAANGGVGNVTFSVVDKEEAGAAPTP